MAVSLRASLLVWADAGAERCVWVCACPVSIGPRSAAGRAQRKGGGATGSELSAAMPQPAPAGRAARGRLPCASGNGRAAQVSDFRLGMWGRHGGGEEPPGTQVSRLPGGLDAWAPLRASPGGMRASFQEVAEPRDISRPEGNLKIPNSSLMIDVTYLFERFLRSWETNLFPGKPVPFRDCVSFRNGFGGKKQPSPIPPGSFALWTRFYDVRRKASCPCRLVLSAPTPVPPLGPPVPPRLCDPPLCARSSFAHVPCKGELLHVSEEAKPVKSSQEALCLSPN